MGMDDILIEPALKYEGCYICKNCVKELGLKKYIKKHALPNKRYKLCGKTRYAMNFYELLKYTKNVYLKNMSLPILLFPMTMKRVEI